MHLAAIFLIGSVALAQSPGWIAMGQGGSIQADAATVTFQYEIQPRRVAIAIRPAPQGLAGLSRLRFRVRSDHDTALAVLLSEHKPGGGNYTAMIWAPANVWQQIELTPADFALSEGPSDPKDADAKLDADQVEGIGVFDFAEFIASMPTIPNLFVEKASGPHTLAISNFEIRTGGATAREPLSIDRFDRGFLEWMTLGGMHLTLAAESPLGGPALEASYDPQPEHMPILTRRLAHLDLAGAKRLAFDIASQREATVLVALELRKPGSDQGPRFNLTIFPPGDRKIFHVNLSLDDFQPDAHTAGARLDPALLKSISLIDVTGASGGDAGANTLWLGNLRAK